LPLLPRMRRDANTACAEPHVASRLLSVRAQQRRQLTAVEESTQQDSS
jgi:hypothetical protein